MKRHERVADRLKTLAAMLDERMLHGDGGADHVRKMEQAIHGIATHGCRIMDGFADAIEAELRRTQEALAETDRGSQDEKMVVGRIMMMAEFMRHLGNRAWENRPITPGEVALMRLGAHFPELLPQAVMQDAGGREASAGGRLRTAAGGG